MPAPLVFLLLLAAVAALLLTPVFWRFVVSDGRTQSIHRTLPIDAGETFQIQFTHSLNLSPVTDTIEWTGKTLVVRSTLFTQFGAGMPTVEEFDHATFEKTEDGFLIAGIDTPRDFLCMLLEEVPNQRLAYRGREIALLPLGGVGSLLRIEVKRVSLLTLIRFGFQ